VNLEQQVVSLDLAKQLKELGVKQGSLWMWVKYELWESPRIWNSDLAADKKLTCLSGKREYAYSSFTVAELGEELAKYGSYGSWKGRDDWVVTELFTKEFPELDSETEANVRAKMLVYLIENNLMGGNQR